MDHQTFVRIGATRRFRSLQALDTFKSMLYNCGYLYSVRSIRDGAGNVAEITVTGKVTEKTLAPEQFTGSVAAERNASRESKPQVRKVFDVDGRERTWRGEASQGFVAGDCVKHRWDGAYGTVSSTNGDTVAVEWSDGTLTYHLTSEIEPE